VLDDFGFKFREVIKPEAAQMAFLNTQDIKLNLLHERKDTIGRSRMGRGNLRYSVDGKGVNFEIDVPKCDIGDRALEMVRSGVYTGCSFEFIPEDYEVEERGANKEVRITHKRFAAITALTIGMDPAYSQTTVNAREMWSKTPTAMREAAEAEAAKKAEEQKQREQNEREKVLARERELAAAQRMAREREIELMSY
jgi:HK97 family phage prohead protease